MGNHILSLSKKLITIRSTKDNPQELTKALEVVASQLADFTIEPFEKNGIRSILVYRSKRRPMKFRIILNGHLDVVPGKDNQFQPKIVGNRLYGMGSMDMKASVACLITVFKEMAQKVTYPLGLQLVTDEEVGGFNGTLHQLKQGVRADFVIAGESTQLNIANKAKGILHVKISTRGKTAHGAYPWKGENAIWKMNDFLNRLKREFPIPKKENWVTTVNISSIETSNRVFNKIPDDCSLTLDMRFIPEEAETVVSRLTKCIPNGFHVDIIEHESPLFIHPNNKFIRFLQKVGQQIRKEKVVTYGANGSSDARHYAKFGGNGIEFGPRGGGIGSDQEWVEISSLNTYIRILKDFLRVVS